MRLDGSKPQYWNELTMWTWWVFATSYRTREEAEAATFQIAVRFPAYVGYLEIE
jgi:hypothetical protein